MLTIEKPTRIVNIINNQSRCKMNKQNIERKIKRYIDYTCLKDRFCTRHMRAVFKKLMHDRWQKLFKRRPLSARLFRRTLRRFLTQGV